MRSGQTLGQYEIGELLGAGGMGEVYRARDTRLGRDVALKFLPEAFTGDDARLSRFEREAQLLAQLHHPNIASIFGLEEADGVRALAMELVEGPTLAERLEQGLPSVEESLSIARQIAEAVEEAHGKGIIHRDLKPLNIKLTSDGNVKVLDFGLAKALDPDAGTLEVASDSAASPTLTVGGTMAGVILGSAPYMSPEQAKGVAVDERADIWSFGVVLFEMLSGERLFTGDSVPETLAGVLKTEIGFDALRADTPPAVRRLLRRCLQRKRKQRLHHIADARLVLEDVADGTDDGETEASAVLSPGPSRVSRVWPIALVLIAAAAGLVGYLLRSEPTAADPMQLTVQLAPEQQLIGGANSIMTFSPDGNTLYFPGKQDGKRCLFQRALTERNATCVEGTEGGDTVFTSPDGRWLGFVSAGRLMKVPVEGGRPFDLGEARGAGGATWLEDDTLIYAPIYSDGLFHVDVEGGEPERLTTPDRDSGELGHWWPEALPGDRKIVFTAFRTPLDRSRIGVLDLDDGSIRWVVENGFFARYVSTGHLLYARGYRLFAIPFDPASATTTGPAVAVLDDLAVSHTGGSGSYSVSRQGTLAYLSRTSGNPLREIVWIDRQGRSTPAIEEPNHFMSVSLSPDNRKAALTIREASRDLWTYAFDRGTLSRLTSSELTEFDPQWSPDGRELFYVVDLPPFQLYRISAGQPDSGRPVFEQASGFDMTSCIVSPDGQTIAYTMSESGTGQNVYTRSLDGDEPAQVLAASRSEEDYPSFSPDGRWIVYESGETGRTELYVEPFPGPGDRVQITAGGGYESLWARNGEIFFRRDDEFFAITTRTNGSFEFDAPVSLFRFPVVSGTVDELRGFDISADGQRMIAVTVPKSRWPRRLEIVTDWMNGLDRIAPE